MTPPEAQHPRPIIGMWTIVILALAVALAIWAVVAI